MSQDYRFGPFTLDAGRRRITREGQTLLVPPKALDVLRVLLENRGRTVEKDEIIKRVWPDTAVEDANLTQSIFVLRRALGDEPAESRYISTVARRGYRFVGDVSIAGTDLGADGLGRELSATNRAAHHAYLKGRHYWSKRDEEGIRAATRAFRQAIDLDPTYALAYVGLAESFATLWGHGWATSPDALITARAAARRALEIDTTMAAAHATLGLIRMTAERDWQGAERSFRTAIELSPAHATARNWFANLLAAQGRFDEAVAEAETAFALDPLNVTWCMGIGHMYFLARRFEDARAAELRALDADPDFWLAHWVLGMTYEQLGDMAASTDALRRADTLSGGNPMVRGVLGRALALSGDADGASAVLDDLAKRHARQAAPADSVGLVHMSLGNIERAIDYFERAAREGGYLLSFLNVSPLFTPLRSNGRFGRLRSLLGLDRYDGQGTENQT